MKLAVSNIAWEPQELEGHLRLLKDLGCDGVEVAPSCIWPEPINATPEERKWLRKLIADSGLEMVGLHALLYNHPEFQLFDNKERLRETTRYMVELIRLCGQMGGKVMVFGSPRNRKKGQKDLGECLSIATDFFYSLALEAEKEGVFVCIEPLSRKESDFITSSVEGLELVKKVGHPNFQLHLDVKAMIEEKEDFFGVFSRSIGVLRHVHVGDPDLSPPGYTGFDHKVSGTALKKVGYNRFISIEMRRGFGPSLRVVKDSVKYVKDCYMS